MGVPRAWRRTTRRVADVAGMGCHLTVGCTIPGAISQRLTSTPPAQLP